MNRRTFITKTGLLAGAVVTAPVWSRGSEPISNSGRSTLRVAHITDTHVFDDRHCPENMQPFLAAFAAVKPAPDLILHTGDVVFDTMGPQSRAAVDRQWNLWRRLSAALPAVPIHYGLGNHDIWSGEPRSDAFFGKHRAMEELRLRQPYYRFDQGGWRFLMLDSVQALGPQSKDAYAVHLDDVQREWLAAEIKQVPAETPLVVCSHVPILSAGVMDWAETDQAHWLFSNQLVLTDSHQVQAVLRQRQGVTLCWSGHLHLADHVVYDGVHYLGNGAVCADWWQHPVFHQTRSGFAIYDLRPDGGWERSYHTYQWRV